VASAAAHARASGASKVAVVDYDVHHGNGTQQIFEHDSTVLYVSAHQYPYYPGTGAVQEIGAGRGTGFTVNIPLEAGAVDEDYQLVFAAVVIPVLLQFAPDFIIVSAGFDAHERDPLGGMRLSAGAFGAMTADLREVAEQCCRGRLVAVTEGGYDLEALAASMDSVLEILGAQTLDGQAGRWPASGIASTRGERSAEAVRRALKGAWSL
jgi:acetoin utilization deacetylase AcuC-like enzyme